MRWEELGRKLGAKRYGGARTHQERQQPGGEGAETISFDEFVTCVALCGCVKYSTVEQMSLAQRVAGIVANFLGEKDEQQVITEAVVPKVERFDPASAAPPTPSITTADIRRGAKSFQRATPVIRPLRHNYVCATEIPESAK